ncbi:MAG: outer membrane beta-barrel protein [Gemmatimonadota bacterium]
MTALLSRAMLSAGLALVLVSSATAQVAGRHQGIWITGGMGFGSAKISCAECEDGNLGSGPTGTLGLGVGLSRRLFLGAEVTGWFKETNGVNDRAGFAALTLRYSPLIGRQLFVGAGAGFGRHRTGVRRDGPLSDREGLTQSAAAWRLESGIDLPLGSQFVLTPNISYNRAMNSDLRKDGSSLDVSAAFSVMQFGLSLSWSWSFPPTTDP